MTELHPLRVNQEDDSEDEYTTSSDDEQEEEEERRRFASLDAGRTPRSAPRKSKVVSSSIEFKLPPPGSSSSSSSDSDTPLVISARKPADKRKRSDSRAEGPNGSLERRARGSRYLDRSPPLKKHMSKMNLETKLYQGAREAGKDGWKSTAVKNKQKAKQRPAVKKQKQDPEWQRMLRELEEDDSSIEFIGLSPTSSNAAARRMSAQAGILKKLPPKSANKKAPVEGSALLRDIQKDTLNQSRAVKRHTTKAVQEAVQESTRILLTAVENSTAAVGKRLNEHDERLSSQDGILNVIHEDQGKVYDNLKNLIKIMNDLVDLMKTCPTQ